jgi:hypothetical protein
MGNFDNLPRRKNEFFHHQEGECYNSEKELFQLLSTEYINQHGVCCVYYVTTWNVDYNRIWGEDMDRFYVRSFDFMTMFELPTEVGVHSVQGFNLQENFHMYTTRRHFSAALRTNGICPEFYDEDIPVVGDIIQTKYNHRFWEITNAKPVAMDLHLQSKHAWDISVIPWTNEQISLSASTSADLASPLPTQVNTEDIFNISDTVDEKKEPINYDPPDNEQSKDPNMSGWW